MHHPLKRDLSEEDYPPFEKLGPELKKSEINL